MTGLRMQFDIIETNDLGLCGRIRGRFDAYATPEIGRKVTSAFLDRGECSITLDLSEVSFLDGAALGTLVRLSKAARGRGGRLRLAAASRVVKRLLRLTTLDTAFAA
jgi:anti-sigma B factor antagonist